MWEPQPLRGAGSQCWHVALGRMSGQLSLSRCLPSKNPMLQLVPCCIGGGLLWHATNAATAVEAC